MSAALGGIRVVEFSSYTAGPLCGSLLAQLGARVVKVEPPDGDQLRRLGNQIDGVSYLFHINNGGKQSVVADLKCAEGRAVAGELVADADVVLENFSPGTLERYGLGYASIRAANPGVVYCSVNGFGGSGPRRDQRAYDVVIQGLAGLVSLSGHDSLHPVKAGPSIVDTMGAVVATSAIIAALIHRRRTGQGQALDIAMYDVAVWLTVDAWPQLLTGKVPGPVGSASRYGQWQDLFPSADVPVVIAAHDPASREALRVLCGSADGEGMDDTALREAVRNWCAARPAAEVTARCRSAGVAVSPVLGLEEVARDPYFRQRGVIVERPTSDGTRAPISGSPLRMSRTPGVAQGFAEPVGASTEAVLADVRTRLDAQRHHRQVG